MWFKRSQKQNDSVVVKLKGSLVAERCQEMAELFAKLAQRSAGGQIILNMQQVKRLDASGIGALVHILKRIKASGGSLSLAEVDEEPRRLLEMLHIHRAIPIIESDAMPKAPAVLELAA